MATRAHPSQRWQNQGLEHNWARATIMSSWRTLRCSVVFVPSMAYSASRRAGDRGSARSCGMEAVPAGSQDAAVPAAWPSADPPAEPERREGLFRAGKWAQQGARPEPPPDLLEARGERAAALAHLGELSAAARALTAEPLAPGNEETLRELRDPAHRPQSPRVPMPEAVLQRQPNEPVRLSSTTCAALTSAQQLM